MAHFYLSCGDKLGLRFNSISCLNIDILPHQLVYVSSTQVSPISAALCASRPHPVLGLLDFSTLQQLGGDAWHSGYLWCWLQCNFYITCDWLAAGTNLLVNIFDLHLDITHPYSFCDDHIMVSINECLYCYISGFSVQCCFLPGKSRYPNDEGWAERQEVGWKKAEREYSRRHTSLWAWDVLSKCLLGVQRVLSKGLESLEWSTKCYCCIAIALAHIANLFHSNLLFTGETRVWAFLSCTALQPALGRIVSLFPWGSPQICTFLADLPKGIRVTRHTPELDMFGI